MITTPRILIVDDQRENLDLLSAILGADYGLLIAHSSPQALKLAAEQPDLILLELMMPAMDGLAVCAQLKAEPATAEIPVIFILSDSSSATETACLVAGAVDFIPTPINPNTLRARIVTHLTLRRQHDLLLKDLKRIRSAERKAAQAIAELEQSRRNLLTVLNQFRGCSLLLDAEGRIQFASDACRAIDGLEPQRMLAKDWRQALALDAESLTRIGAMMATPASARSRLELTWTGPHGQSLWVECDVRDDPGDARRRLLFLYDVTEVRELCMASASGPLSRLTGASPTMHSLRQRILDIARGDWTVIIEGETGTGKELVAKAIHAASPRANGPFITVNAAGLTPTLLTSQLFGHRKGAFTGAYRDQEGFFESACGGTLFLDEIGDLPIDLQAALLRVLQEKEITRIGETQPRKVDVRIVAATNQDLVSRTLEGHFRQDLLYRLRVVRIQVPPLRERLIDIPLLARLFLDQASQEIGRQGLDLSASAVRLLTSYEWPGNVRELKSCIEQAVICCKSHSIEVMDLPPELQALDRMDLPQPTPPGAVVELPAPNLTLPESLPSKRERILAALAQTQGNRLKAAKLLGIGRATLYRHMAALGLNN